MNKPIQEEYELMLRTVELADDNLEMDDIRKAFFCGAMVGMTLEKDGHGPEAFAEFCEFMQIVMTDEMKQLMEGLKDLN